VCTRADFQEVFQKSQISARKVREKETKEDNTKTKPRGKLVDGDVFFGWLPSRGRGCVIFFQAPTFNFFFFFFLTPEQMKSKNSSGTNTFSQLPKNNNKQKRNQRIRFDGRRL
jgi:hypothetical protein